MTTTAPRTSPSASRRPLPTSSPSSSISRGATARSAASPRASSSLNSTGIRRNMTRSSSISVPSESNNDLSGALKEATERKEQLLVQLQDKEQTISSLGSENAQLTSALHAAETRLNELYAEQNRSEMELAQRIDISEKLRDQVRELEREKREISRRYNEQTSTFDAERQAFYDNEQHLKSRIQSLIQARNKPEPVPIAAAESETEAEDDEEESGHALSGAPPKTQAPIQESNDSDDEPAEMTALKLELSTLSTSYSSLQSTLVLLQGQLAELNRVNKQLQEENESYLILLRERTLSGQFDVLKQVGASSSDEEDDDRADEGSVRSTGRNTLDRVEEEASEEVQAGTLEQELGRSMDLQEDDSTSSRHSRTRQGRKRGGSSSRSPDATRGESLADLPITGPGLDLAAELGRAENKDILDGKVDDSERYALGSKNKRSRKDSEGRKGNGTEHGAASDVVALRSEVKALKDANKALSLYASKIIDRIIAQEGFEHVLAVDYDHEPVTPSTAAPSKGSKPRPQSVLVGRSSSMTADSPKPSTPSFNVPKLGPPPAQPNSKAQRRSLSFDWKSFSIFNNSEKKPDPNLRPLTLKPGASPVTGGRKLDTQEDEDDRRERERINATMKLMGITAPTSPAPMQKAFSSPGPAAATPTTTSRRFSLFGSRSASAPTSETSSLHSTPSLNGSSVRVGLGIEGTGLTQELLEHAEAENTLAALDAHEKALSAEIAKGSSSGFTEIRRSTRRGRRSAGGSGSGSTVWSAGLSGTGEDE